MFSSGNTEKSPQFVLEDAYSDIIRAESDETEESPASRQSGSQDRGAPAAPAAFSGQHASSTAKRRPARRYGKK